jgi:hypothetical protein
MIPAWLVAIEYRLQMAIDPSAKGCRLVSSQQQRESGHSGTAALGPLSDSCSVLSTILQWSSQNGFHVHTPSSVISMSKVSRQLSSTLLYGALSESGAG